jgi:hypothetical protein
MLMPDFLKEPQTAPRELNGGGSEKWAKRNCWMRSPNPKPTITYIENVANLAQNFVKASYNGVLVWGGRFPSSACKLFQIARNIFCKIIRSMAQLPQPPSTHSKPRESIQVCRKLKLTFFICCFSCWLIKTTFSFLTRSEKIFSRHASLIAHLHRWQNWPKIYMPCAKISAELSSIFTRFSQFFS